MTSFVLHNKTQLTIKKKQNNKEIREEISHTTLNKIRMIIPRRIKNIHKNNTTHKQNKT